VQRIRTQQATQHVSRARKIVQRQRELIEKLRGYDTDTDDAENMLKLFERSPATFEADLARIEKKTTEPTREPA
jgi:hypothetical protein